MKTREEIEALAAKKYPSEPFRAFSDDYSQKMYNWNKELQKVFIEVYEQAQNDSQPLLTAKQAESICMGFYKDLVVHLESGLSTELFYGELVFNKHLEKATK
jgi:hypothetical protein